MATTRRRRNMPTVHELAEAAITQSIAPTPPPVVDDDDDDEDWMKDVPQSYQVAKKTIFDRLQANDPDYVHYWVKISPDNQAAKKMRYWVPLEDPEVVARICKGVIDPKDLPGPGGRLRWKEHELWRRPLRQDTAIRRYVSQRFVDHISNVHAQARNEAADTTGRSQGKVRAEVHISRGTTAN